MVTEQDFNKCMKLNLYSAVEAIKAFQDSLKKSKGSVVLFSTVAAQRGFTNHSIICLLYTSPSPRDATLSRMPSSA